MKRRQDKCDFINNYNFGRILSHSFKGLCLLLTAFAFVQFAVTTGSRYTKTHMESVWPNLPPTGLLLDGLDTTTSAFWFVIINPLHEFFWFFCRCRLFYSVKLLFLLHEDDVQKEPNEETCTSLLSLHWTGTIMYDLLFWLYVSILDENYSLLSGLHCWTLTPNIFRAFCICFLQSEQQRFDTIPLTTHCSPSVMKSQLWCLCGHS